MKRIIKRHLAVAALAIAALAGVGGASFAQGTVRAQHGDWQMSCDTPPRLNLGAKNSSLT